MTVRRILIKRTLREMDKASVTVEIQNRSRFEISGLIIEDKFKLSKDATIRLAPEKISPRSILRWHYVRVCDGGMGKHTIGPLIVRVTDPLGIFEFRIIEDEILETDVYPKIERIPAVPVYPSVEGYKYGNYEVASRGLSVNFSGVRPYQLGDSLRHIAWKLSTRGQGLMVKEFEKVVSCDVNVVLNLAPRWQIGKHADSTWEYCKDIALSVIQQQLDLGNTVAFFSDRSFVEPGAGSDHFHSLARHISGLRAVPEAANIVSELNPLAKFHDLFSRGSNVFYVTPFNLDEIKGSTPWLKRLRAEGYSVVCVLIDTNSFWLRFIESISTGLLIGAKVMLGLEDIAEELKRSGIRTFIAVDKKPLREIFR